jgi:hypothetical protein
LSDDFVAQARLQLQRIRVLLSGASRRQEQDWVAGKAQELLRRGRDEVIEVVRHDFG